MDPKTPVDPVAVADRLAGLAPFDTVDWALVCGSGLGVGLLQEPALGFVEERVVPLAELGLPAPSVQGHGHALVFGRVAGRPVCVQTGRLHPYEGHPVGTCVAALDALLERGVGGLVLTCAVGALTAALVPGSLALLRDQINLLGPTPLVGPRFIDCAALYSASLRARAQRWAAAAGAGGLPEVVYIHARGPQYETPAETGALRALGGDVVGMSTTYEALCAASHGVPTVGLAVVTNAAGAPALTHDEVQERSAAARGRLAQALAALLATDARGP